MRNCGRCAEPYVELDQVKTVNRDAGTSCNVNGTASSRRQLFSLGPVDDDGVPHEKMGPFEWLLFIDVFVVLFY